MRLKKFFPLLLLCFSLCFSQAFGEAYDNQFSLSLDLLGQNAFVPTTPSTSSIGIGGSFFFDWRPLPQLSFGTGFDFTEYTSGGGWQTGGWNLGARIFPIPSDKGGEFYLQTTAGLNVFTKTLTNVSPGNFHGTLGAGYRIFMNKENALDLGAQYDYFSPRSNSLNVIGLKVGWTFLFGDSPIHDKESSQPKP